MNAYKKNSTKPVTPLPTSKQHWHASLPYPSWPFGTVGNAEELEKYERKLRRQAQSAAKSADCFEEALM